MTFIQGDLTNQEDLTKACQEMDMVVHAGALSTVWGPLGRLYQTNVLGTKYVLEACRRLISSAWYMCRLQEVSMQRLETSWISKKAMPLRKIGLTITFEVNWHQKTI